LDNRFINLIDHGLYMGWFIIDIIRSVHDSKATIFSQHTFNVLNQHGLVMKLV